jgi:hypothetical protein
MLKPFARIAAACAALAVAPALAQTPPVLTPIAPPAVAAAAPGQAEGLAWRGFQACLAISRGAALDKAALEAGFLKDEKGWVAEIGERTLTIELATPPAPPGARACVVVSRGPLADHAGFNKRLAAWATREGFAAPVTGTTAGGGQTTQYATADGARIVVLAFYPDTGKPEQPTRSLLFVGWTPAP